MIGKNNPFNIRFVRSNHWIGQTGQTDGFVDFSDVIYGIRAAALLVMRSYRSKGILTISEIINHYAPATENNTRRYIDFVCERLGVFPFDIPKNIDEYYKLLTAMSCFEGNRIEYWKLKEVCEYFGIKPIKSRKK